MKNLKYSDGSATYVESLEKKITELEKQIVAIDMNNEPVAWMVKGTPEAKGYGYVPYLTLLDATKSSYWAENKIPEGYTVIPLYTHPVKEQYKFGVDWSKDGNAVTVLKICEDGVAEVVFMDYQEATHPVKELTDEEILKMAADMFHYSEYRLVIDFARAIMKRCGIISGTDK